MNAKSACAPGRLSDARTSASASAVALAAASCDDVVYLASRRIGLGAGPAADATSALIEGAIGTVIVLVDGGVVYGVNGWLANAKDKRIYMEARDHEQD